VNFVRCPRCGRPGRVERDWLGDERVVCDSAYDPCGPEEEEGDPFPWDEFVCDGFLAPEAARWEAKLASWRKREG
jgi:hypothetical protein